jgi:hypothetical protein
MDKTMKNINSLLSITIIVFLYSIFMCNRSFAYCDRHIQFSIIPDDSWITYTPISDPDNPSPTERFGIKSGTIDIYIHQPVCGYVYIRFENSSVITNPLILPYGDFKLPEGVAGVLDHDTFTATSYGACGEFYCSLHNEGGTVQCFVTNIFETITGVLYENELNISGINDIEPSYHFHIKAVKSKASRSCFPWHILLPSLYNSTKLLHNNEKR